MNAGTEDPSVGAMIAGMLVLGTLGCSLLMIAFWVMRYLQFGYVLPNANRGYLRIPMAGTVVGIVVGAFLALLATLMSVLPMPAEEFAATSQGTAPATDGQQSPDSKESSESADSAVAAEPSKEPATESATEPASDSVADNPSSAEAQTTEKRKLTPEMMWGPIITTLFMDLILFGVFALMVYAFSFQSRVRGPATVFPEVSGQSSATSIVVAGDRSPAEVQQHRIANLWPDLDEAHNSAAQGSAATSAQESAEDPFAAPLQPNSGLESGGVSVRREPENVLGQERFSLLCEVRFAGEVFLASYFPTTLFRLAIVFLISVITGEQPDQHPFLEMLKEGIDVSLMAAIFLMAVILAPVVEELFYRVVILGGLCQQGSVRMGMIISCLLFSFAHGFPDSLALLPLAAALGYTYVRRQSYVTVMLVHFFFNAFNMIIASVGLM